MASPHFKFDPAAIVERRTADVDAIVSQAYSEHLSALFSSGLALVAVGGYGRRELFPYSDVDLLILVHDPIEGDVKRNALSTFLRVLWDAGLRLSQSVRTIDDCTSFDVNNIELSVSLIDQRFLTGDAALYDELNQKLPKFFASHKTQLMRHLIQLTLGRHGKYQHTIYHLEPNIKETPGGMRDLHVVHWLERLRSGEVVRESDLLPARQFLGDTRIRLHNKFKRDANALTFDSQEELHADAAAWMREYFRHARQIYRSVLREIEGSATQTENSLLRQFRDWRSRLSTHEFTVSRERILFRSAAQLASDPEVALRLFALVARHGLRLAVDTYRRLEENRQRLNEYFTAPRQVWPTLRDILSQPHSQLALREMNESGVLLAIFPEWEQIECLVVRDFYHRYTVDEHSLMAIEAIHELRTTNEPQLLRFSELLTETDDLPLLDMALLFHDVGKSGGLEGHSERSAVQAARALARIQMPDTQRDRVLFLIEHHLDLSAVMLGRDINDPAAIRDLAQRLGTIENLKLLALLTYGDISAVNPTAMTPWRLEQLWRIYLRTYNELTRELESDRIHDASGTSEHADFLEGLPVRYLRTHDAADIARHAALEQQSMEAGAAVAMQRADGSWSLTVVTPDKPGLFAMIAGSLSSFGMNILRAEAFSNQRGNAVDTFAFADPMRNLELNPDEAQRLENTVRRVVTGRDDVRKLLRGRARPASTVRARLEPTVAFDSHASEVSTLVEIVAEDRPGLLYDLASTFSAAGCNIDVVLIDTEARKALDVFYVNEEGHKLTDDKQEWLRIELLRVCSGAAT